MNNRERTLLIEMLKQKANPTKLEKHIIDTANVLTNVPFNSFDADSQIEKNNKEYPKINVEIRAMPNTVSKPASSINDTDRYYILNMQLELLCMQKIGGAN